MALELTELSGRLFLIFKDNNPTVSTIEKDLNERSKCNHLTQIC